MTLAIDSQETSNAGHHGNTGILTWSFTNTSGSLLVVGCIATVDFNNSGTSAVVTGVSYNGVALTQIGTPVKWDGSNRSQASLWYLLSPATGSNTVSVSTTYTGGTAKDTIAGAVSFTGNDGTTPVGTSNTALNQTGGGSSPATVSVSSTTVGNIVVAVMGTGSGYTSTSNTRSWSSNVSGTTAGDNAALTTQSVSSSSTTMTDTITTDWWGIIAVEVLAGTGGGGFDPSTVPWSVPLPESVQVALVDF